MNSVTRSGAGLLLLACCALAAAADELRIGPEEMARLGVTLASPQSVTSVEIANATARVAIPPSQEFVLTAPHAGLIVRLDAAVGDAVTAGQALAGLRSTALLTLQREYLEALNHARLARGELARDRELHAEGLIAERRLRETETRARVTEAGLSEHRQMLRIGGLTTAELEALTQRATLLDELSVRAPVDGVVLERMAVNGARVAATEPLYRIADLSTLWLEIAVPQERAASIRQGMAVATSAADERIVGRIALVGRTVDPSTQSVLARVIVADPDPDLRPGQFLTVRVLEEQGDATATSVVAVPLPALIREGGVTRIFVRTSDGFELRPVELAGSGSEQAYVRGVEARDRIAVTGVSALKAMLADAAGGGP